MGENEEDEDEAEVKKRKKGLRSRQLKDYVDRKRGEKE